MTGVRHIYKILSLCATEIKIVTTSAGDSVAETAVCGFLFYNAYNCDTRVSDF